MKTQLSTPVSCCLMRRIRASTSTHCVCVWWWVDVGVCVLWIESNWNSGLLPPSGALTFTSKLVCLNNSLLCHKPHPPPSPLDIHILFVPYSLAARKDTTLHYPPLEGEKEGRVVPKLLLELNGYCGDMVTIGGAGCHSIVQGALLFPPQLSFSELPSFTLAPNY